ncbi:MAG: hypothetical protein GVY16_05395 [Planctomycetes bacterium]|nr:hypothetical protein [Planctomycetota bacterium]
MAEDAKRQTCNECGRACDPADVHRIDDEPLCARCLYGRVEPVTIRPIGVVANDKRRRQTGFGTTGGEVSEIRLAPGMARFLHGLADESHLTVVWLLHAQRPLRTRFNRGWDGKEVGPFASRTPDRLTPIAVTDVELLGVEGTTLTVRGLDAIDGTPVLDIKVAPQSLRGTPHGDANVPGRV